jgi:hypothetical protein
MLSVILYGRNDSHGYNLHKRAALSLNALAAVLTEPDDELIFVDYNTPDELPTFPEAIADTLTADCRKRLRILRVRPAHHARFAGQTRLVALEPQSRNIAIRRANPRNRWVLSTNTDMIFWPENPELSLSKVVAGLEDGFYHLPRFEAPEGFWERLQRTDPAAAMAAMHDYGRRFHFNEVVYGAYDNLYEAPGDFQLFLRQDLFDIRGFDERMILGWHADSNMARRMKLLRGEVRTAFPKVLGYHCGHTRQATSLHGGNRTENSSDLFVRNVESAVAPGQDDSWGAPDEAIEEVRLDHDDRYLAAMGEAVRAEGPAFSETIYNDTSWTEVGFQADHVLPHLCDIVFNLPAGQTVFFFGDDVGLLEGLRAFLETAGREPRFVLSTAAGAPAAGSLNADRWSGSLTSLDDALDRADLIVLQYPHGDRPAAERRELEWRHHRLLSHIAHLERARPKAERRRIVVVNGLHNGLTALVESVLAPSTMPFSSRLRQGFVIDAATGAGQGLTSTQEWPILQRLGRTMPFNADDMELLKRVFAGLSTGRPLAGWERLAPEVAAICASPAGARSAFALSETEADDFGGQADAAMRGVIERLVELPERVGPRPGVGNRLCSGDDWSDNAWLNLAIIYFGHNVVALSERRRWMWERVSLIEAVRRVMPLQLPGTAGAGPAPRLLLVAEGPEPIAPVLVHLGYDVTYAASPELLVGRSHADWTPDDLGGLSLPPNMRPLNWAADPRPFDAVVFTKPALFEKPSDEVEALLAATHAMMARGGLLFCASTVQLNEQAFAGGFSFAEWKTLYEPQGPLGARGFESVAGMDTRVPLDAAVRFALQDDPQETVYGLSHGLVNSYITSALITARWPQDLRPGPEERVRWPGPTIDPVQTVIPYGPVHTGSRTLAPQRRRGGDDLSSRAFRAIEAQPVKIDGVARNILPFAQTEGWGLASPTGLSLPAENPQADLGPWFSLCLDAGEARRLVIQIEDAEGGRLCEVETLVHGAGRTPVVLEGPRAVVSRDGPLGRVSVACRLDGGPARLTRLNAWTET